MFKSIRIIMVWNIALRDLMMTLRDRRTLAATILIPMLIIPLITLGMPYIIGKLIKSQSDSRQVIGFVGEIPKELKTAITSDIKKDGKLIKAGMDGIVISNPAESIQSGKVDAAIQIIGKLPSNPNEKQAEIKLYAKLGNLKAQAGAFSKIEGVIQSYNESHANSYLKSLGVRQEALSPILIKPVDVSKKQEKASGQLAFLVPMLVLQFILSGAMATALDSTAGEKERGTLESLLVSPVRRSELVAGKLLSTTTVAVATAMFTVIGFMITGALAAVASGKDNEAMEAMGGQISLTGGGIVAMIGATVSAAVLISAMLIALGIHARNFKEAQTYAAPLSMLIIFPSIALQFSDFLVINFTAYLVPLIGSMLVILNAVKGQFDVWQVVCSIMSNLAAAAFISYLALLSFEKEEVVFRN